jgi:hypothetical protein
MKSRMIKRGAWSCVVGFQGLSCTASGNDFNCLESLQNTHGSNHRTENSTVGTANDTVGRRRLWEDAAITRTSGIVARRPWRII